MVKTEFLEVLRDFTREAIKDMILPTRMQQGDTEPGSRPADVYLMRLPDGTAAMKKAPYILHQVVTGADRQEQGERPRATATVRSIFVVYSDDEQEGGMMLLELMERVRIALLKQVLLDKRFQLDLQVGVETLVYPDDTAPYFAGEMSSTWVLPAVERVINPQWLM